jgi:hypothetical protein
MGNHLIGRFADAGLRLQLARAPIARALGAEVVFQMDIRRARAWDPHSEYYVAWPGAADNVAVVQGVDRAVHQLVMMVHEPKRWFWEEVPTWQVRNAVRKGNAHAQLATRARVPVEDVRVLNNNGWVRRTTDERKRHFLAGRDERQLFMCRLPRACATVADAHRALRAPEVVEARSALERPIRQGEWFFVTVAADVLELVGREITGHRAWVRRKVSIGSVIPRAGKPHVADELVVLRHAGGALQVFVRGAVRHVDHKTIRLYEWHRVYRNREVEEGRSPFGGTWID